MKLFFVTPPSHTHSHKTFSTHNRTMPQDAPEADDTVSRAADQLLLVRAQAHRPDSVLVRVVSAETQKKICAIVLESTPHSSLTVCCQFLWGFGGLGFGFCLELRRSSNLVSGILMKGERSTKTPPLKCKLSSPLPPSLLSPR